MTATEWTPTTATELSRLVSENFLDEKKTFSPVGGRTSLSFASEPVSSYLVTQQLQQVIDYPSRDMTITVEAGIRVEALQEILVKEGQQLPIDIPQAGRATLGGAIATNTSGPSRYGYGTFRDYVIGISAVDAQGRLFSAGGRVVKNVAGYDLCKLLIGSRGSLATITEVTLKLRPVSESQVSVLAAFPQEKEMESVLSDLNTSATRPTVLDVLSPKAAWQLNGEANQSLPDAKILLWIEFTGTEAEIAWQVSTLKNELQKHQPDEVLRISGEAYQKAHQALVEFQTTSDDPLTFHTSFPKSLSDPFLKLAMQHDVAMQIHAGTGVAYGHLPDRCPNAAAANEIISIFRSKAVEAGGGLTVLNCDPEWAGTVNFHGTQSKAWELMRKLKQTLDPASLMNPQQFLSQ